jgi:hypothetical protein
MEFRGLLPEGGGGGRSHPNTTPPVPQKSPWGVQTPPPQYLESTELLYAVSDFVYMLRKCRAHRHTLPRTMPYYQAHCPRALCADCRAHCHTLSLTLPHTDRTAGQPHTAALPHCRTLPYTTKRTARTLPCALPQTAALPDSRTIYTNSHTFKFVHIISNLFT